MAIINPQIFSAQDFTIIISFANKAFYPIRTTLSISMNTTIENEKIYAIGQTQPIANKRNADEYKGTIEMQLGEFTEMAIIAGVASGTQIQNATISIAAIATSNATVPFARTYGNVMFSSEKIDIKAKDKDSKISMDFEALTLN